MNKSENINELAKSLSKVQAILTGAVKDSKNPFFNSKYADLESVWDSIREPLAQNGFSVSQLPTMINGEPGLETILMHESGQYISSAVVVKPIKNDPQSYGSAYTYFRRYALAAIVGQVQVDDDANQATGNAVTTAPSEKKYNAKKVTDNQLKRLYAIQSNSGLTVERVKEIMKEKFKIDSAKDLSMSDYDSLIEIIENEANK
jgi:hypothetical protein